MTSRYAGAEWIRKSLQVATLSPLGVAVADLLGDVFCGIYHLDNDTLSRVDWGDTYVIVVPLHCYVNLSTFDNELLTKLVVLSHDRYLRLDIRAAATVRPMDIRRAVDEEWSDDAMRELGSAALELMFHLRKSRTGSMMDRMPTMETHLASIRQYYPPEEETPC